VVIKHEGKEYAISQEMWDAMNADAAKRDMTIDEYIVEAFTLLREQNAEKY
jgi:hypothetical protein